MTITVRETFVVSCSQCGHTSSHGIREYADRDAAQHEREHDRMRTIGEALKGQVFDVDVPERPTYFWFDKAVEAARAEGYGFLTWNGWVYAVRDSDLNKRLCMAKDAV